MTEDEFNTKVEAELNAQIDRELQIERQAKRDGDCAAAAARGCVAGVRQNKRETSHSRAG